MLASRFVIVNHKNIYHKSKMESKDLKTKTEIEELHKIHPAYGHRRIAIALGYSKKKVLRVMHKFGLKPPRRKVKRFYLTNSVKDNFTYTNLIKNIEIKYPFQIWISDLTYIKRPSQDKVSQKSFIK
jgi:hypothetical protein